MSKNSHLVHIIDGAYTRKSLGDTNVEEWQSSAVDAVMTLQSHGVRYEHARLFVAEELAIAPEKDYSSISSGLVRLLAAADSKAVRSLVERKETGIDLDKVVGLSDLPDRTFYKLESGSVEGKAAYRANPYGEAHHQEHIITDRD